MVGYWSHLLLVVREQAAEFLAGWVLVEKLPISIDRDWDGGGGKNLKINNDDRPSEADQTQKPLLSIYPISLNPNVRRRQSTMVSKAYKPYRLVWR